MAWQEKDLFTSNNFLLPTPKLSRQVMIFRGGKTPKKYYFKGKDHEEILFKRENVE
jgi:hypothetical protein